MSVFTHGGVKGDTLAGGEGEGRLSRLRCLSSCIIKASLLNYWGRLKFEEAFFILFFLFFFLRLDLPLARHSPQPAGAACEEHPSSRCCPRVLFYLVHNEAASSAVNIAPSFSPTATSVASCHVRCPEERRLPTRLSELSQGGPSTSDLQPATRLRPSGSHTLAPHGGSLCG